MNSDPLTVIHGDALTGLAELQGESVQTCVTSPPYWGLRSYGTEPLVWDNHNGCEHKWGDTSWKNANASGGQGAASAKQHTNSGSNHADYQERRLSSEHCNCGAWRGELGLEPQPELYVSHLVQIFREVKRVLRKDGTCWINLGDSYATGGGRAFSPGGGEQGERYRAMGAQVPDGKNPNSGIPIWQPNRMPIPGLKPKDLVGIPWLTAFALRADGWYLRSDIIWSKPNPMPESVKDRPTKSHEYIFLLSKSQKYYFDQDAVREPHSHDWVGDNSTVHYLEGRAKHQSGNARRIYSDAAFNGDMNPEGRNIRSVWTVTTSPFPDAHFATFPPDLIKPCVLAGAPSGGVVLDPFAGSGTTGKVAIELGRKVILIEPKAEYVETINRRCQTTMGFQF